MFGGKKIEYPASSFSAWDANDFLRFVPWELVSVLHLDMALKIGINMFLN
jgi:hypothetical protein